MLLMNERNCTDLHAKNARIPQAYDCPLKELLLFCEAKRASGVIFAVSLQPTR